MRLTLLIPALFACKSEEDKPTVTGEPTGVVDAGDVDTDVDSDADSDADTDTDADTDIGEAPVANSDTYSADQDVPLIIDALTGVLANDTDPQGDPLTAALLSPPTSGTLLFSADGSFEYQPISGFVGPDSFTYLASDTVNDSQPTTVSINVTVPNDPPTTTEDLYEVTPNTALAIPAPGVLDNDEDPEGDLLTVTLVTDVASGTLALSPDGAFVYTPDLGYEGLDGFIYEASDGFNTPVQSTVALAVGDVPFAPVATDDTISAIAGVPRSIPVPGVLYNDTDANGDLLTAILETPPANGTLVLALDGSFTYTAAGDFGGEDSFTYRASDGALQSDPATVTINVSTNTPPTGADDNYSTSWVFALNVNAGNGVLDNDEDADGDPLTAELVDGPTNGTLNFDADGSFRYEANILFNGTDTFTYRVSDGVDLSDILTVEIFVF